MAKLIITPPIPRCRGLVLAPEGAHVEASRLQSSGQYETLKVGKTDGNGEFYFTANKTDWHQVIVTGDGWRQTLGGSAPAVRTLFSDFRQGVLPWQWQTRVADYIPGKSDYSKAADRAFDLLDGRLNLRVLQGDSGIEFDTANLGTQDRFQMTNGGWASARMRMQPYTGAHTGFWLQTAEDYIVGQSEVDVVEYFGADNPARKSGINVHHTIWWNDPLPDGRQNLVSSEPDLYANSVSWGKRWDTEYHVYTVHWTPGFYDFWIDGRRVGRIVQGLSTGPKFPVLSILVRNWEHDALLANLKADGTRLATYNAGVEWVAAWQL